MNPRTMVITGHAALRVEPDLAIVRCRLTLLDHSYAAASRELNQRVEDLAASAAAVGLSRADFKTSHYHVTRETRREERSQREIFVGYEATHTLEVRLPLAEGNVNAVTEACQNSKARPEVDVSFGLINDREARAQLLTAAVQDARERAEVIARAAGVRLGGILNVTHGMNGTHDCGIMTKAEVAMPGGPGIEPGAVALEDSVTVTWEIAA